MKNHDNEAFASHISERQLVDYVQHEIKVDELHLINSHLIGCSDCAERLSSLILFAAENQLLKSEQENVIDNFLASPDYTLLKRSFIEHAVETYSRKGSKLIRRITGITFSFSFNIRLTS
jgi:hypothetical protein